MSVIAIFSGCYCHGEEVAQRVAERLGYERIEDELLDETSKRFGVSTDKLRRSLTGPPPFWNNFTCEREKNIACMKLVLSELIAADRRLVYGYVSHLVPSDVSHVLRVCVIANFAYRVEQAVLATGNCEKEAAKIIHKQDEKRLQWTQCLFEKAPYDESLYDLIVPMQDTSPDEAVDLICEHTQNEPIKTTRLSRLAARDALLAAKVDLALTMANHDVSVTCKKSVVTIGMNRHVMRVKHYEEELKCLARQVSGVKDVRTELGPKYRVPAINPMSNIELPPKILLVDDEEEFVHTMSERLQRRDLASSVVYNGQQALDFVDKDQPDVMVLDLLMPGIGGIEVLRRIKRTHPNIEVIILTGRGSDREEQSARELGAFAYLKKPVNIDLLAEMMRRAYEKINEAKAAKKEHLSDS